MEQILTAINNPMIITIIIIISVVYAIIQRIADYLQQKNILKEIKDIEKETPDENPVIIDEQISQLAKSHDIRKENIGAITGLMQINRSAINIKHIIRRQNKQIELYHQETRARARWSFAFAVVTMAAGFIFVMKGGTILLTAAENIVLVSGTLFSTIGAVVSGYIAKTFLDIHKTSLQQLNEYFQQPVLNDHILTAQRLADESNDPETRKKAYEKIIESITKLIEIRTLDTEKDNS